MGAAAEVLLRQQRTSTHTNIPFWSIHPPQSRRREPLTPACPSRLQNTSSSPFRTTYHFSSRPRRMSADAHQPTSPNARKRTRSTMQAADPTAQAAAQPADGAPPASAEDGFVVDNDAIGSGDDEDEEGGGKSHDKKAGRRKIKIEFIQDKSRRHITFSKRKAGKSKDAPTRLVATFGYIPLLSTSAPSFVHNLLFRFSCRAISPLSRRR